MAGTPRRLARSAGTDIADSLPPLHAPRAQRWTAPGGGTHKGPAASPIGALQRRGPGVRMVIGARALALSADKHNESTRRTRSRGRWPATSFRGRSARRRQTRSAAARPQDAAVYGRCSRSSARMLMNLSKRQHLPRRGLAGRNRPNSPLGRLFRSCNPERTGGLLLASRAGLILDSASGARASRPVCGSPIRSR